jgi:hypothetical protein
MTRYILNSGGLRNNPVLAKKFFLEIINGFGNKPRILFCFFAKPREEWEEKFRIYTDGFRNGMPQDCNPVFTLAFPDKFVEQIKLSDVIYIHGGDDHLIQYWLKQFNLPTIWQGKVIATNSAGSHALVRSFWTCDWRKCMDGLGILPIKFLAHYESNYGSDDPRGPIYWQKAYEELAKYGDTSLPIHALHEGEYIVIEQ